MAKRQQRELAADHPDDGGGSDASDASGFSGSELLKNYYHLQPIMKAIRVAEGKKCRDLDSLFSQVPCGQRSKGRVRREKVTKVQDAGSSELSILEERKTQCQFGTHPRKPRNMRGKRKVEPSESQAICQYPLRYCRQSRREHHSTTAIQKWGKLDTEKFELYMENVWRRFTEEKKNVCTYLDSLWFSLYSKGPLKAKVLSWIKRKDIFSKKYVFVPIVQCPQSEIKSRCILLLDSLQAANSKQLEPGIRRFVVDIFKIEERPEKKELISKIPLLIPKVPQQKGGEECGFFVLYYINLFLESAPDNFSFSLGYPDFMKEDWFTPEEVESFVKSLDSMNTTSDCLD